MKPCHEKEEYPGQRYTLRHSNAFGRLKKDERGRVGPFKVIAQLLVAVLLFGAVSSLRPVCANARALQESQMEAKHGSR